MRNNGIRSLIKALYMKKLTTLSIIAMFAAGTAINSGCKPSTSLVPDVDLPDISDFTIEAIAAFTEGASALISIASTTLDPGTYTIYYDLTGANPMTGLSAVLTIVGSHGSFSTPSLAAAGDMSVKIKSISNSAGGSSTISGGGATYTAKHVRAYKTGAQLNISATIWTPLTAHNLYINNYYNMPLVANFNKHTLPTTADVIFQPPGTGIFGEYGTITVTSSSPIVNGTFSYTGDDSSKITLGTFSVKAP